MLSSHTPFSIGFVGGNNYRPSTPYHRVKKKQEVNHRYRIFITGDKESGKTALICRLFNPEYQRAKYTLSYGFSRDHVQIGEEVIYLRLNDIDTNEFKQFQHDQDFLDKLSFDADIAFIVIKLKKKRSDKELELYIQERCQAVRAIAPNAHVVLVASKSDKVAKFKTTADSLKAMAIKLKCLGAALVNDSLENVQRLFQATVETLIADKKARLAPPALINASGTPALAASSASFFAPTPAPQLNALSGVNQAAVTAIQSYVDVLIDELCSFFALNRRRKLLKIGAMRELMELIQRTPEKRLDHHIAFIRNKYAETELEIGTRTIELFARLNDSLRGAPVLHR